MSLGKTITKRGEETYDLRQCWRTPVGFFRSLHRIFEFTVDACASEENALLPRYWTKKEDCLQQDWNKERAFCNPPFGAIREILVKACSAKLCAFLLPASGITALYSYDYPPNYLLVPKGRIAFISPDRQIKSKRSPFLGTVVFLYGQISEEQLERLNRISLRGYRFCF